MRTHAPTLNNCRDKNSTYLNISQNKAQPLQKQCVASCIASFSPQPMGHPKMSPRDTSKRAQGTLQKEPKGHLKESPWIQLQKSLVDISKRVQRNFQRKPDGQLQKGLRKISEKPKGHLKESPRDT